MNAFIVNIRALAICALLLTTGWSTEGRAAVDAIRGLELLGEAASVGTEASEGAMAATAARRAATLKKLEQITKLKRPELAAGTIAGSAYLTTTPEGIALPDRVGKSINLDGVLDDLGKFHLSLHDRKIIRDRTLLIDSDDTEHFDFSDLRTGNPHSIAIIDDGSTLHPVRRFRVGNNTVEAVESRPNLYLEIGRGGMDKAKWVLEQPLYRHDIAVISLFDRSDAETLHELGDALGELHHPIFGSPEELFRLVSRDRGRTSVIVGHVEDGAFAVRNAAGEIVRRYRLEDIREAAAKSDNTVLFLGCDAAVQAGVSGLAQSVRVPELASALSEAVQQSTVGDYLTVIARRSGELLIRTDFTDPDRIRFIAIKAEEKGKPAKRVFSAISGEAMSADRATSAGLEIIPGVGWYWPVLYGFGVLVSILSPRKNWRAWKQFYLDAPDRIMHPIRSLLVKTTRFLAFFIVWPVYSTFFIVIHFSPLPMMLITLVLSPATSIATLATWTILAQRKNNEGDKIPLLEWFGTPLLFVGMPLSVLLYNIFGFTDLEGSANWWKTLPILIGVVVPIFAVRGLIRWMMHRSMSIDHLWIQASVLPLTSIRYLSRRTFIEGRRLWGMTPGQGLNFRA